jgi:hypothetical protein
LVIFVDTWSTKVSRCFCLLIHQTSLSGQIPPIGNAKYVGRN